MRSARMKVRKVGIGSRGVGLERWLVFVSVFVVCGLLGMCWCLGVVNMCDVFVGVVVWTTVATTGEQDIKVVDRG